jgi:hypothetical protein
MEIILASTERAGQDWRITAASRPLELLIVPGSTLGESSLLERRQADFK